MGHVTSVLGLENHLESQDPTITMVVIVIVGSMKAYCNYRIQNSFIQKQLKCGKKYFTG